jgi:hypothetical protein
MRKNLIAKDSDRLCVLGDDNEKFKRTLIRDAFLLALITFACVAGIFTVLYLAAKGIID